MKLDSIINIAREIRTTYGDEDAGTIAAEVDLLLLYYPMGTDFTACKGFILSTAARTAITVNADLSDSMREIIAFHELSHYFLHIRTGIAESMHDFSVGDSSDAMEYEANLLTAELMLSDEAVMEALEDTDGFYSAALQLDTLPELLDLKLRLMKHKGYDVPDAPIDSTGEFLRKA